MSTDSSRFDDWLKKDLRRDLAFRATIWTTVAMSAAYFAIRVDATSVNAYLIRQSNSILRSANIIGSAAICLGIAAMMFKDMEVLAPKRWGRATLLGGIGGVVRRLAADLTLWTLSALISMLVAGAWVGFASHGESLAAWALFSAWIGIFGVMVFGVATLNVWVRRSDAPIARYIESPRGTLLLAGMYAGALLAMGVYLCMKLA
jgi:hypothetical protein